MNRLWLIIDRDGVWSLPSDYTLIYLDLDKCDIRWHAQKANEWPREAILHSEVLGLVTANYERNIQTIIKR